MENKEIDLTTEDIASSPPTSNIVAEVEKISEAEKSLRQRLKKDNVIISREPEFNIILPKIALFQILLKSIDALYMQFEEYKEFMSLKDLKEIVTLLQQLIDITNKFEITSTEEMESIFQQLSAKLSDTLIIPESPDIPEVDVELLLK